MFLPFILELNHLVTIYHFNFIPDNDYRFS